MKKVRIPWKGRWEIYSRVTVGGGMTFGYEQIVIMCEQIVINLA